MGAERPLERQKETVSACWAIVAGSVPRATAALKIRAPSRWTASPAPRAMALACSIWSSGITVPPAAL